MISQNVYTKPISTRLLGLINLWVQIHDPTFIFQSLKGCCYGNQFWGGRIGEIGLHRFHLSNSHPDERVNSNDDPSERLGKIFRASVNSPGVYEVQLSRASVDQHLS